MRRSLAAGALLTLSAACSGAPATSAGTAGTAGTASTTTARSILSAAPSPRRGVTAFRTALMLAGSVWRASGVDDYRLTSDGVDEGCDTGLGATDVAAAFASLPERSVVRTWAWQGILARKGQPSAPDWGALDRVVAAARVRHDVLILSLASQDGTCDGGMWKGLGWYQGGYRSGLPGLSYLDWVGATVRRYRANPVVAMWEPVNEPEASTCGTGYAGHDCYGHLSCPSEPAAARALRRFFDDVGAAIHDLDPGSLVEEGTIGTGQCGTAGADYAVVGASPGLDVLSVHDYSDPAAVLAGDGYNGPRVRLGQAGQLAKPLVAGEIGVPGSAAPARGCPTDVVRATDLRAKVEADFSAGFAGALVWDEQPSQPAGCSYELAPGDPYLKTAPLSR